MIAVARASSPACDDVLALALDRLQTAPRELLDARSLLRRCDTKFTLPVDDLPTILYALAGSYAVVRLPHALATYRSLYFDTPELQCFHDHRRGRRVRHKVRIRQYPDRSSAFLELKTRKTETITEKHRVAIGQAQVYLGQAERAFLRERISFADAVRPQLWIDYHRITLVGVETDERVTVDLDIDVGKLDGTRQSLGAFAVIEVKQAALWGHSPVMRVLAAAGLRPASSSKYSAAVALLRPDVRMNRLLPGLRALERIA